MYDPAAEDFEKSSISQLKISKKMGSRAENSGKALFPSQRHLDGDPELAIIERLEKEPVRDGLPCLFKDLRVVMSCHVDKRNVGVCKKVITDSEPIISSLKFDVEEGKIGSACLDRCHCRPGIIRMPADRISQLLQSYVQEVCQLRVVLDIKDLQRVLISCLENKMR